MDVKSVLEIHVKYIYKGTIIQLNIPVNQFVRLTATFVLLRVIVKAARLIIVLILTQAYANSNAV